MVRGSVICSPWFIAWRLKLIHRGRWRVPLHGLDQHPPLGPDARIWMGSYAFTAIAGRSGEAVRSLLLWFPVLYGVLALAVSIRLIWPIRDTSGSHGGQH